jgi:pantoate--beta-alanine ligase
VNPLQFGPAEDLETYPRDEANDIKKLDERGCHALFVPTAAEMFPDGEPSLKDFKTVVHVSQLTEGLCGAFRPGHFEGVATIVTKLFMIVQPDAAYFGEKDFQQLQVIRRMCRDLNIPVTAEGIPTVREPDGLAVSSRNRYLPSGERGIAPRLYRTLCWAAERFVERDAEFDLILEKARRQLLDAGFTKVDYITAADTENLQPLKRLHSAARIFAAAWLGRTRLIENVPIEE